MKFFMSHPVLTPHLNMGLSIPKTITMLRLLEHFISNGCSKTFSTSCFLIYQMPTVVLRGNVPFSILFPGKPMFPVEPRSLVLLVLFEILGHITKLDTKPGK